MEGDNVRVVDDGSGEGYEQGNPPLIWWKATVTTVGIAIAVTLLIVYVPAAVGGRLRF